MIPQCQTPCVRGFAVACVFSSLAWAWLPAHAQTSGRTVAPVVVVAMPPLTERELAVVPLVHVGVKPCELGNTVRIDADEQSPGHFHLTMGAHRFHLRPVHTSTGAVRLEDQAQGAVWIQLPNKSMLMSQKLGRRLADECASPVQRTVAEAMKTNPGPPLLDVAQTPR